MKEVLLNIGSIVKVEHRGELSPYLIVGKRMINFNTMNTWDYYSVPYPEGAKRDNQGRDDNGFYFNHYEIDEIIFECKIEIEDVPAREV